MAESISTHEESQSLLATTSGLPPFEECVTEMCTEMTASEASTEPEEENQMDFCLDGVSCTHTAGPSSLALDDARPGRHNRPKGILAGIHPRPSLLGSHASREAKQKLDWAEALLKWDRLIMEQPGDPMVFYWCATKSCLN